MAGIGLNIGMAAAAAPLPAGAEESGSRDRAVDDFLAYMKKSLAERMADAWLASHGLDRQKLKAMTPAEREAVLLQMARELRDQLKLAASGKRSAA